MRESFLAAAFEAGYPAEWADHWFGIWATERDPLVATHGEFVNYLHAIEARRTMQGERKAA